MTTAPAKPRGKARSRVSTGLREIYVAPAGRLADPRIVEQDDLALEIESAKGEAFVGRVYFAWMEHSDDGGCDRDPATDPHEDLAYVGKTLRELAVRWAEHLVSRIRRDGAVKANNSAVYRNRRKLTGWSADERIYPTPEALMRAELRAIKTLWPAWNIQDQDRRNPHTRASRSRRRPDRLAPLISVAAILWGLLWATVTAGLEFIGYVTGAPWWAVLSAPAIALWIVNGTMARQIAGLAKHERRTWSRRNRRGR